MNAHRAGPAGLGEHPDTEKGTPCRQDHFSLVVSWLVQGGCVKLAGDQPCGWMVHSFQRGRGGLNELTGSPIDRTTNSASSGRRWAECLARESIE